MRLPNAALVLGAGLVVGCGSGGADPVPTATGRPGGTATPGPTVSATPGHPSPLPSPSPAPTPPDENVVLLGVGSVTVAGRPPFGPIREERPLIVRHADESWTVVETPEVPAGAFLLDVTFSSDTTAWAWGWISNDDSFVLASTDAGLSWQLAPGKLPPVGLITDLWFRDESTGWAVGGGLVGGLWIAATRDAGRAWDLIDHDFGSARLGHQIGARGGVVEVAYNGRVLQEVAPVPGGPREFVPEGFFGRVFETFSDRGWYGGSYQSAPSILSAAVGDSWTQQRLDFDGMGVILSVDFRDPSNGLACGRSESRESDGDPICFYTTDGGSTWSRAATPETGRAFDVDVVWGPGDTAWAVTWSIEPLVPVLLRSADGGRSWESTEIPFQGEGLIRRLARSTETRGRD